MVRIFLRNVLLDPVAPPQHLSSPKSTLLIYKPIPAHISACTHSISSLESRPSLHHVTNRSRVNIESTFTTDSRVSISERPLIHSMIQSTACWASCQPLSYLLDSYSLEQRARILFLLYGPIHQGRIMWASMCENTAANSDQLTACFGELGAVLANIGSCRSLVKSRHELLALFDALILLPDDWLAENVACLLFASGPQLGSLVIENKAVNGRMSELAIMLTSLCLVRVKVNADLADLIYLVGRACRLATRTDRCTFLDQLARAFQDVIVELYETEELEDRLEDFSTILRAQAEFMRALMAQLYEE